MRKRRGEPYNENELKGGKKLGKERKGKERKLNKRKESRPSSHDMPASTNRILTQLLVR